MTNPTVNANISAACDYLDAATAGVPEFTAVVEDVTGPNRIYRGMAALLLFLVADAAVKTETHPGDIIQRIRENYGE